MPVFKNRVALEVTQRITAFLNLDAGLIRGKAPDPELVQIEAARLRQSKLAQARELERARAQIAEQEEQIERARAQIAEQEEQIERARAQIAEQEEQIEQAHLRLEEQGEELEQGRREVEKRNRRIVRLEKRVADASNVPTSSLNAENIVWVFGTIRTGSTWLGRMMGDMKGHAMWNEPRVGELFGHFFYERAAHRRENENFILGLSRKLTWLKSIRAFVLDSVSEKYPRFSRNGYVVIKEPSGSIGAPLLAEALPESRMILLVRDPRDMVASALDAAREDSWARKLKGNRKRLKAVDEGEDSQVNRTEETSNGFTRPPAALVEENANMYLQYVGNSKRAYDAHEGPKVLVRYEDLRADALGTMRRIYSELEIEVDEEELGRVVEKHSWENIPQEERGPGKFNRKATPGGWREDLTAEQARTVEEITAPLLEEFYSE